MTKAQAIQALRRLVRLGKLVEVEERTCLSQWQRALAEAEALLESHDSKPRTQRDCAEAEVRKKQTDWLRRKE